MDNLFEQLRSVLQDLKDFLTENTSKIDPAFDQIATFIPQVRELITTLIDLMNKLKAEVNKFDIAQIPNLTEASAFASRIGTFLVAAKKLLPNEASTIETAIEAADVIGGLPALTGAVKTEIIGLIDAIITQLNVLKA